MDEATNSCEKEIPGLTAGQACDSSDLGDSGVHGARGCRVRGGRGDIASLPNNITAV